MRQNRFSSIGVSFLAMAMLSAWSFGPHDIAASAPLGMEDPPRLKTAAIPIPAEDLITFFAGNDQLQPGDDARPWTIIITGTGPCFSGSPLDSDVLGKQFVTGLLSNGHNVGVATIYSGSHHVLLEE